jgi:hypothetical protein
MLNDYQKGSIFGAILVALSFAFALSHVEQPPQPQRAQQSAAISQDHQSQETSWGDPMSLLTLGLLVIAGIQAGLFIWQLQLIQAGLSDAKEAADAARDAALAARDSALAATRQAKIAEDAFVKRERPYLFVFGVKYIKRDTGILADGLIVEFSVANFGTDARHY